MPQIRKSGSTGVKADIDIGSAKYRAIGQAAGQIQNGIDLRAAARAKQSKTEKKKADDFEEQRLRHKDEATISGYKNERELFKNALGNTFKTTQDADQRREILEKELNLRAESVNEQALKITDPDRRADFINDANIDNIAIYTQFDSQIVTDDVKNDNAKIRATGSMLAQQGNFEEAAEELGKINDLPAIVEETIREELSSAAASISENRINNYELRNNADALKEEFAKVNSGSDEYKYMSSEQISNTKGDINQASSTIAHKQVTTFASFMSEVSKTGVYDPIKYQEAVNTGLLPEEYQKAIQESAPSAKGRKERLSRFKEDKKTVGYQLISKELDVEYFTKFAEGENVEIEENEFEKYENRINSDPRTGVVAKNNLKALLLEATSQAVVEADWGVGTEIGEKWDDLSDDQRKIISSFSQDAAIMIRSSLQSDLKVVAFDEETGKAISVQPKTLKDLFLEDINDLADSLEKGDDLSKIRSSIADRLKFYRTGMQRAKIRELIRNPKPTEGILNEGSGDA